MAAGEVRRAIVGRIPDSLRNCVNKEYFTSSGSTSGSGVGGGGMTAVSTSSELPPGMSAAPPPRGGPGGAPMGGVPLQPAPVTPTQPTTTQHVTAPTLLLSLSLTLYHCHCCGCSGLSLLHVKVLGSFYFLSEFLLSLFCGPLFVYVFGCGFKCSVHIQRILILVKMSFDKQ